jgi:hypothetical protein
MNESENLTSFTHSIKENLISFTHIVNGHLFASESFDQTQKQPREGGTGETDRGYNATIVIGGGR